MSSHEEVEIKLLDEYLNAAIQADESGEAIQKLALYEKQLALCKDRRLSIKVNWCDAMVYYLRAHHKLITEGVVEKALRSTARESTGFDGIGVAMMAKNRETSRLNEAISLMDKAIATYDDDVDFWFFRAALHQGVKNKGAALNDVNHILEKYGGDQDIYLHARKLKDEIETMKSDCFIATAVYGPSEQSKTDTLRWYRDNVLLKSRLGKTFVHFYYLVSPKIAKMVSKSSVSKIIIRYFLLEPIVKTLRK